MNPLVSVVVPTFNRANLIAETIQSVIDQTYTNWELIIVDDGSTDQTEHVVSEFNNPKINYFKLEHSGKLGKVRNYGIRKSKGEWVALLDSDDLWRKDKLEIQIWLLNENPSAKFCFSNSEQFGEGASATVEYEIFFSGNIFRKLVLNKEFTVCMPTLIFERTVTEKIVTLNENWQGGGDIDFFYRLAYHFPCVFTNEKLARIRKHEQSTSLKLGDLSLVELLEMFFQFREKGMISEYEFKTVQQDVLYKIGLSKLRNGEKRLAMKSFYKFVIQFPFHWKGYVRLMQTLF